MRGAGKGGRRNLAVALEDRIDRGTADPLSPFKVVGIGQVLLRPGWSVSFLCKSNESYL